MAELSFSTEGIDPLKPLEALPPGDYAAAIVASGFEPTKDGRGSYLKLELQILEGPHQGRKLFDRLNLNNPKPEAVDFARRALAAICHAVGKVSINSTEELHNKPMLVKVKTVPMKKDGVVVPGEWSNEVKGYAPKGAGGTAAVGGGAATTVGGAASSGGGGALPWQRT